MNSLQSGPRDRASPGRIPELDGLRGIAIALVVLYHYVYMAPAADSTVSFTKLRSLFCIGWSGVDLFFVLSGFLIGGILLDARESPRYFKTFYARRFFRIIPLYYLWITLYFVFTLTGLRALLQPYLEIRERWISIPTYYFFLQNLTKNLHSPFGTAWLGHLWSLAVEEQFYLFMPLAIRFLPRKKLLPVLIATVPGATIARIVVFKALSTSHAIQYQLTPCRADALAMGVLLAVFWRDEPWKKWLVRHRAWLFRLIFFLLCVAACLVYFQPSPYSFAMTAWGLSSLDLLFSCLLMIVLLFPETLFGSFCRSRLLRELGRVSYCVYIVHEAVHLICHRFLFHQALRITVWQSAALAVLSAFVSYGIAWVSWKCFENPLLRRGHAFQY